ncbi:uncharacterized protein LOC132731128 [Ruditapes philippinarum]|uniref:uncharacterized protein LOC132731128 n=1 Tax=Ruditapes philippinarum TaxID=129788 RepID=UPI00295B1A17|nr:uncharacterized protein LOC132731128 [Ruditapes philippinarum]
MADKFLSTLILIVGLTGAFAEICTNAKYSATYDLYENTVLNCLHGCCGDNNNQYCCVHNNNVGLIVGISLGSTFLVAGVATVIVVVMCCCRKSRGQSGHVVQPMVSTVQAYHVPGQMGAGSPVTIMTTNARPGPGQQW